MNKKDIIGLFFIWLQGAIVGYIDLNLSDFIYILVYGIGWFIGVFIFASITALIALGFKKSRSLKIQALNNNNMKTVIKHGLILSTVCFVVFLFVPIP